VRRISPNVVRTVVDALSVEAESGYIIEDGVSSQQRRLDVDRGCGDPQIVCVNGFVERVTDEPACVAKLSRCSQQGVADWHNRRRGNGLFQLVAALFSPASDERAVTELCDGDRGNEDLVPSHELHMGLETRAPASADGRAEDAGVDEDPHNSRAAENASSSSSDRSSIRRESIESSTGAASS
jgi:hypothetical protein